MKQQSSPALGIPTGLSRWQGEGSATSEFVCIGDQPGLDFGQFRNQDMRGSAAFGNVVKGMDIARQLNSSSGDVVTGEGYTAG